MAMRKDEEKYPRPPGPWDAEPNLHVEGFFGYPTCIVRNVMGHLCGYIAVPVGHPWHGKHYDDVKTSDGGYPEVHGGLTFSCAAPDFTAFEFLPDAWVLGFDCAHSGDLVPGMLKLTPTMPYTMAGDTCKDMDFVTAELVNLANQADYVVVAGGGE